MSGRDASSAGPWPPTQGREAESHLAALESALGHTTLRPQSLNGSKVNGECRIGPCGYDARSAGALASETPRDPAGDAGMARAGRDRLRSLARQLERA